MFDPLLHLGYSSEKNNVASYFVGEVYVKRVFGHIELGLVIHNLISQSAISPGYLNRSIKNLYLPMIEALEKHPQVRLCCTIQDHFSIGFTRLILNVSNAFLRWYSAIK